MGEWNAETRRDDNRHRQKGPVLCFFLASKTSYDSSTGVFVLCFALLWALASRHLVSPLRYPVVLHAAGLASWLLGFLASFINRRGVRTVLLCAFLGPWALANGQRRVFSSFSRRLAPTSMPHQTRPRPRSFCSLARPVVLHGFAFLFRCSTAVTTIRSAVKARAGGTVIMHTVQWMDCVTGDGPRSA